MTLSEMTFTARRSVLSAVATAALIVLVLMLPCARTHAQGAADRRLPSVGYVYPAGGQIGTVFEVVAGGQNLRGTVAAHISGEGVTARILRHISGFI